MCQELTRGNAAYNIMEVTTKYHGISIAGDAIAALRYKAKHM